jgi:hypothetical protein
MFLCEDVSPCEFTQNHPKWPCPAKKPLIFNWSTGILTKFNARGAL